ncbi:MAG TPA: serine/threonine-protein kinase, partial [Luteitalea sp.]|nr:serine/threonine-protein kinase [Luteitalea sp.]
MDVLPTHISHYEIRRVLGQGGMGVVYLAFDPGLQRQAAVKVLRTNNEDQRERFRREARIVARLQHPNIVQIYGVGEHESQPYIAMEYIPGEPLSEAIRRRAPWGLQRKLLMGVDLCAGLAFAHRAGVIHRDVKPSNLIVSNGPGTIRLLDFGIARGIDAGATMGLTMQGNIVGTLNYMSPEQITGKAIDHRSDIFAVGLVLYELITYRKAFPGDNLATLTYRIVHGTPEPIRSLQPDADEELCTVVERAMAR